MKGNNKDFKVTELFLIKYVPQLAIINNRYANKGNICKQFTEELKSAKSKEEAASIIKKYAEGNIDINIPLTKEQQCNYDYLVEQINKLDNAEEVIEILDNFTQSLLRG